MEARIEVVGAGDGIRSLQPRLALLLILLNLGDVLSTYIGLSTGFVVESNSIIAPLTDRGLWLELTLIKVALPMIALVVTLRERCRVECLGMALVAANVFYTFVVLNNVWVTLSTVMGGFDAEIAFWSGNG